MIVRFFWVAFALISITSCSTDSENSQNDLQNPMKLWYNKPAQIWEEALPVGNGRLGAMVYGGVKKEVIQFNEETVWTGEPGNNIRPDIKEYIPEIRKLIFEGKYKEAQDLANKLLPFPLKDPINNHGMIYQTVGNLEITFPDSSKVTDYRRDLDISKAKSTVTYTTNGVTYRRNLIASLEDDIIVMEITADQAASISCTIAVNTPHKKQDLEINDNEIWLRGTTSDHENKKGRVQFTTIIKPKLTEGELTSSANSLVVKNASKLVIYLSAATNFINYKDISGHPDLKAKNILEKVYMKDFNQIEQAHIAEYKKYFDRVNIDLGSTDSINNPTDVRLGQFNSGNDPQLVALYYQFGRYLLISSSQPGTQPANLQGIWSEDMYTPWDGKYTININTEMNYWPAEPTNLPEMHQPLFDMLEDLSESGKESASQIYGARGWHTHHNTDIWRITGIVDGGFYGIWPMGGAWLSQHLFYHYWYNGDKEFLKEKYDILKGLSLFYKDILVEEPENNWLVVCPSMSPENHHNFGGSLAAGTTMDNQILLDVFQNVIEASEILNIDEVYADSLRTLVAQLAPMQIGKWGQLQEWMHDWDRRNDHHRHVSHLYGLFPSNQISPYRTPELLSAAKTSLIERGDESTGWSMGWKVNLWARFLDGNHALKLISDQLKPAIQPDGSEKGGTYPNLFDSHAPFQIDGNFGCTSGITEMLLQSHDGAVHLLPALPDSWKEGSIAGIKARGGFVVYIHWQNGELATAKIESPLGGNCRIRSYVPLQGEKLTNATGDNSNPFYQIREIKEPLIHSKNPIEKPVLKEIYEYDIETKAGDVILVNKQ